VAPPPFLDTNDHPDHSPRASAYLDRVERGELRVRTADTVVFETVHILERIMRQPKAKIRDQLIALLDLTGVVLPGKRRLRRAFTLYVDLNLPFADAYHAALAAGLGLTEVVSFDHDFDRVPGLRRVEP
jgi:predicted nucleic acid-binding protein